MKRRLKIIPSAMLVFSLFACPYVNATNENGYAVSEDGKECTTTKEFEADTDDTSTYDVSFDEEITLNHKKYKLADVSYDVVSAYDGKYDDVEETITVIATDTNATAENVNETITKNGLTYELKNTSDDKAEGESVYLYKYTYYNMQQSVPNYPESVSYTYTMDDGTDLEVELPFESIKETSSGWNNGFMFDGTIENYDADYWEVEGQLIPRQDNGLSFSDSIYETLVKKAGYDPEMYKDFSATYIDDSTYTNSEGVVCRDFIALCSAYGTDYQVKYAKMFDELKPKYKHTFEYSLSQADKEKIESAKSLYSVTATAKYSLIEEKEEKTVETKNETVKKVVISAVVIVLLLVFISLGVYLAKGGRKDTDYRSKRDSRDDYKKL